MNNGIDVFINVDDDECILCMNAIDRDNSERLHCHHHFCKSCIDQWFDVYHHCPLCDNSNAIVLWENKQNVVYNESVEEVDDDDIEVPYPDMRHNLNLNFGDTTTLEIYAMNYNVLRIMSGLGGLSYSN